MTRIVRVLFGTCLLVVAATSHAAFDCKLIQGKEGGDRIRIVVYAEAFTQAEEDFFEQEVREGVEQLFTLSPWREYRNHFVIYQAWTPSVRDYIGKTPSDSTFFRSTFDGGYSHLPYAGVPALVDSAPGFGCKELSADALKESYSVVVVNLSISMLITGIFTGNRTVLVSRYGFGGVMGHELGHAIAGLSDEYAGTGNGGTTFFGGVPVRAPVYNIAATTEIDLIPWKVWISPSTPIPTPETEEYDTTIGLFVGADYSVKNRYKPSQHCMMRGVTWNNALPPMCVVCREALAYKVISRSTSTDPWDPRSRIRLDTVFPPPGSSVVSGRVGVVPIAVDTMPMAVRWSFNARPVSAVGNTLDVGTLGGNGVLEAVMTGASPFIRNPAYIVRDTLRWKVGIASGMRHRNGVMDGIRRMGPAMFLVPGSVSVPRWARGADGRRVSLRAVARTSDGWLVRGSSAFGEVLFPDPEEESTNSAGGVR
ncbi:MAG: hypothetical protein IPK50_22075 [Fibrobacterota bacterium]|nr:MAG: hypothetical protein IPK50_22075 [Fibrobacterota bacterium]